MFNKTNKKTRVVATIAMLGLMLSVALAALLPAATVVSATKPYPFIVQSAEVPGVSDRNNNFAMPTVFDAEYTIQQSGMAFEVLRGGGSIGSNTSAQAVADLIQANMPNPAGVPNIRLTFSLNIGNLSQGGFFKDQGFHFSRNANYVINGSMVGDRTNSPNHGLLHFSNEQGAVWVNNATIRNVGSWHGGTTGSPRNRMWPHPFANQTWVEPEWNADFTVNSGGLMLFGHHRPIALSVSSNIPAYILGTSNVSASNSAFLETVYYLNWTQTSLTIADPGEIGYDTTTRAFDPASSMGFNNSQTGIGRALTLNFAEVDRRGLADGGSGHDVYHTLLDDPAIFEYLLGAALMNRNGATGTDRNLEQEIFDYYRPRGFEAWVASTRTTGTAEGLTGPGFGNDFNFFSNHPGAQSQSGIVSNGPGTLNSRDFIIGASKPSTGPAILFGSSNHLVINLSTGGVISSQNAAIDPTGLFAPGTIALTSTTATSVNRTRLHVIDGDIRNDYYDVVYERNFARRTNITGPDDGMWMVVDEVPRAVTGYVFFSRAMPAQGGAGPTDNTPGELYEGGLFQSRGNIILAHAPINHRPANITIGLENGLGPTMRAGFIREGSSDIAGVASGAVRFVNHFIPNNTGAITVSSPAGTAANTQIQSDLYMRAGTIEAYRIPAVVATNTTPLDVTLSGGAINNGTILPLAVSQNSLIINAGASATVTVRDTKIDARVAHNNGTAGVFAATGVINGVHGTRPSFELDYGANVTNHAMGPNAHILFMDVSGNAVSNPPTPESLNNRNVLIRGGEYRSENGAFIAHHGSDASVIMTGGNFENTLSADSTPVLIGNVNPTLWQLGHGGRGTVYLNGGTITSTNNSRRPGNDTQAVGSPAFGAGTGLGLVNIMRTNRAQPALVMGIDRGTNYDGSVGQLAEGRSEHVTRLHNRGDGAFIVFIRGHLQGGVAFIDRLDLEGAPNTNAILARNFRLADPVGRYDPTINFTGTLSSPDDGPRGVAYSSVSGRRISGLENRAISGEMNTFRLTNAFDDLGFKGVVIPHPTDSTRQIVEPRHSLTIPQINSEYNVNGFMLMNITGDRESDLTLRPTFAPSPEHAYANHFFLFDTDPAPMGGAHDGHAPHAMRDPTSPDNNPVFNWGMFSQIRISWYSELGHTYRASGEAHGMTFGARINAMHGSNIPNITNADHTGQGPLGVRIVNDRNWLYIPGYTGQISNRGYILRNVAPINDNPRLELYEPGYIFDGWEFRGRAQGTGLGQVHYPSISGPVGRPQIGIPTNDITIGRIVVPVIAVDDRTTGQTLNSVQNHVLVARWRLAPAVINGEIIREELTQAQADSLGLPNGSEFGQTSTRTNNGDGTFSENTWENMMGTATLAEHNAVFNASANRLDLTIDYRLANIFNFRANPTHPANTAANGPNRVQYTQQWRRAVATSSAIEPLIGNWTVVSAHAHNAPVNASALATFGRFHHANRNPAANAAADGMGNGHRGLTDPNGFSGASGFMVFFEVEIRAVCTVQFIGNAIDVDNSNRYRSMPTTFIFGIRIRPQEVPSDSTYMTGAITGTRFNNAAQLPTITLLDRNGFNIFQGWTGTAAQDTGINAVHSTTHAVTNRVDGTIPNNNNAYRIVRPVDRTPIPAATLVGRNDLDTSFGFQFVFFGNYIGAFGGGIRQGANAATAAAGSLRHSVFRDEGAFIFTATHSPRPDELGSSEADNPTGRAIVHQRNPLVFTITNAPTMELNNLRTSSDGTLRRITAGAFASNVARLVPTAGNWTFPELPNPITGDPTTQTLSGVIETPGFEFVNFVYNRGTIGGEPVWAQVVAGQRPRYNATPALPAGEPRPEHLIDSRIHVFATWRVVAPTEGLMRIGSNANLAPNSDISWGSNTNHAHTVASRTYNPTSDAARYTRLLAWPSVGVGNAHNLILYDYSWTFTPDAGITNTEWQDTIAGRTATFNPNTFNPGSVASGGLPAFVHPVNPATALPAAAAAAGEGIMIRDIQDVNQSGTYTLTITPRYAGGSSPEHITVPTSTVRTVTFTVTITQRHLNNITGTNTNWGNIVNGTTAGATAAYSANWRAEGFTTQEVYETIIFGGGRIVRDVQINPLVLGTHFTVAHPVRIDGGTNDGEGFDLSGTAMVNFGTYTFVFTGIGNYTGTRLMTFTIGLDNQLRFRSLLDVGYTRNAAYNTRDPLNEGIDITLLSADNDNMIPRIPILPTPNPTIHVGYTFVAWRFGSQTGPVLTAGLPLSSYFTDSLLEPNGLPRHFNIFAEWHINPASRASQTQNNGGQGIEQILGHRTQITTNSLNPATIGLQHRLVLPPPLGLTGEENRTVAYNHMFNYFPITLGVRNITTGNTAGVSPQFGIRLPQGRTAAGVINVNAGFTYSWHFMSTGSWQNDGPAAINGGWRWAENPATTFGALPSGVNPRGAGENARYLDGVRDVAHTGIYRLTIGLTTSAAGVTNLGTVGTVTYYFNVTISPRTIESTNHITVGTVDRDGSVHTPMSMPSGSNTATDSALRVVDRSTEAIAFAGETGFTLTDFRVAMATPPVTANPGGQFEWNWIAGGAAGVSERNGRPGFVSEGTYPFSVTLRPDNNFIGFHTEHNPTFSTPETIRLRIVVGATVTFGNLRTGIDHAYVPDLGDNHDNMGLGGYSILPDDEPNIGGVGTTLIYRILPLMVWVERPDGDLAPDLNVVSHPALETAIGNPTVGVSRGWWGIQKQRWSVTGTDRSRVNYGQPIYLRGYHFIGWQHRLDPNTGLPVESAGFLDHQVNGRWITYGMTAVSPRSHTAFAVWRFAGLEIVENDTFINRVGLNAAGTAVSGVNQRIDGTQVEATYNHTLSYVLNVNALHPAIAQAGLDYTFSWEFNSDLTASHTGVWPTNALLTDWQMVPGQRTLATSGGVGLVQTNTTGLYRVTITVTDARKTTSPGGGALTATIQQVFRVVINQQVLDRSNIMHGTESGGNWSWTSQWDNNTRDWVWNITDNNGRRLQAPLGAMGAVESTANILRTTNEYSVTALGDTTAGNVISPTHAGYLRNVGVYAFLISLREGTNEFSNYRWVGDAETIRVEFTIAIVGVNITFHNLRGDFAPAAVAPTGAGLYPTLPEPASDFVTNFGYQFDGWRFGSTTGDPAVTNYAVHSPLSHQLHARWIIVGHTMTPVVSAHHNDFTPVTAGNTTTVTSAYRFVAGTGNRGFSLGVEMNHPSGRANFRYEWVLEQETSPGVWASRGFFSNNTYQFMTGISGNSDTGVLFRVDHSGTFRITLREMQENSRDGITITQLGDRLLNTVVMQHTFVLTITPQLLSHTNIDIPMQTFTGAVRPPSIIVEDNFGVRLTQGIDFAWEFDLYPSGIGNTIGQWINYEMLRYELWFVFMGNYGINMTTQLANTTNLNHPNPAAPIPDLRDPISVIEGRVLRAGTYRILKIFEIGPITASFNLNGVGIAENLDNSALNPITLSTSRYPALPGPNNPTLTLNVPEGYRFVGWFLETGRMVQEGDSIPPESHTLFARWEMDLATVVHSLTRLVSGVPYISSGSIPPWPQSNTINAADYNTATSQNRTQHYRLYTPDNNTFHHNHSYTLSVEASHEIGSNAREFIYTWQHFVGGNWVNMVWGSVPFVTISNVQSTNTVWYRVRVTTRNTIQGIDIADRHQYFYFDITIIARSLSAADIEPLSPPQLAGSRFTGTNLHATALEQVRSWVFANASREDHPFLIREGQTFDFEISIPNNAIPNNTAIVTNVGSYTVRVDFRGNYSGFWNLQFVVSAIQISFDNTRGTSLAAINADNGQYPTVLATTRPNNTGGFRFIGWIHLPTNTRITTVNPAAEVGTPATFDRIPLVVLADHTLTAVWTIDTADMKLTVESDSINPTTISAANPLGDLDPIVPPYDSYGNWVMEGVFRAGAPFAFVAVLDLVGADLSAFEISYVWTRGGTQEGVLPRLERGNVADSGVYIVTVTIRHIESGLTQDLRARVELRIRAKRITDDNINFPPVLFTGNPINPVFSVVDTAFNPSRDILLVEGVDFRVVRPTGPFVLPGHYEFQFFFDIPNSNYDADGVILYNFRITTDIVVTLNGRVPGRTNMGTVDIDHQGNYDIALFLPAFTAGMIFEGYTFVGWYRIVNEVRVNIGINNLLVSAHGPMVDHTLYARWEMNALALETNNPLAGFTFGNTHTVTGLAGVAGIPAADLEFIYTWSRPGFAPVTNNTGILQVTNVAESGLYTLTVEVIHRMDTVLGEFVMTSTASMPVNIQIHRQLISAANITIDPMSFNGEERTPNIRIRANHTINGQPVYLVQGVDFEVIPPTNPARTIGNHVYTFNFLGNYQGAGVTQNFEITNDMIVTLDFGFEGVMLGGVDLGSFRTLQYRAGIGANGLPIYFATGVHALPVVHTSFELGFTGPVPRLDGYIFIGWRFEDRPTLVLGNTRTVSDVNHTLTAVWSLVPPHITIVDRDDDTNPDTEFNVEFRGRGLVLDINAFIPILMGIQPLGFMPLNGGPIDSGLPFTITWIEWSRVLSGFGTNATLSQIKAGLFEGSNKYLVLTDVQILQRYRVTITVECNETGWIHEGTFLDFIVTIRPTTVTASNITVTPQSFTGQALTPEFTIEVELEDEHGDPITVTLVRGVDFEIVGHPSTGPLPRFTGIGEHALLFSFMGNYTQDGSVVSVNFVITNDIFIAFDLEFGHAVLPNNATPSVASQGFYRDSQFFPYADNMGAFRNIFTATDIPTVAGFEFHQWRTLGGRIVENGDPVVLPGETLPPNGIITLVAVWRMRNDPTVNWIDIASHGFNSNDGVFTAAFNNTERTIIATIGGGVAAEIARVPAEFTVTFIWASTANLNVAVSSTNTLSLANVNQSGSYRITITILKDGDIVPLILERIVSVEITPIVLTRANVAFEHANFNGQVHRPVFVITCPILGVLTTNFTITPANVNYGFVNVGQYSHTIAFAPRANHTTDFSILTFEIRNLITVNFDFGQNLEKAQLPSGHPNAAIGHYVDFGPNPTAATTSTATFRNLPTPTAEGYLFVGWTFDGRAVTNGSVVLAGATLTANTINLIANWEFDPDGRDDDGRLINRVEFDGPNNINRVFTGQFFTVTVVPAGPFTDAAANSTITYSWARLVNNAWVSIGNTTPVLSAREVADSGTYRVTIVVERDGFIPMTLQQQVSVSITPMVITRAHITFPSRPFDGTVWQKTPAALGFSVAADVFSAVTGLLESYTLVYGQDYTVTYPARDIRNLGSYDFVFRFGLNFMGVVEAVFMLTNQIVVDLDPQMDGFITTNVGGTMVQFVSNPAAAFYVDDSGLYRNLPILTRQGYEFEMWALISTVDGVTTTLTVGNGHPVAANTNHTLSALWRLSAPSLEGQELVGQEFWLPSIEETYRWADFNFAANPIGLLPMDNGTIDYTFSWQRVITDEQGVKTFENEQTGSIFFFRNVADSGLYRLRITAIDDLGRMSFREFFFNLTVNPIIITAENVQVPSRIYSGSGVTPEPIIINIELPDGRVEALTMGPAAHFTWQYVDFREVDNDYREVGIHQLIIMLTEGGNFVFKVFNEETGEYEPDQFSYSVIVDFEVTPNRTIAIVVGSVAGAGALSALGILGGFWGTGLYKRKKYGMKRHTASFMDKFKG
ncbi:MAG: hypothetical protein FWD86_00020 [Firmicutes bacterium]|nr:hypothetical protein [Bacillota bacterium]